jgi:hypothetical protein
VFAFLIAARFAAPIVSLPPYQFAKDRFSGSIMYPIGMTKFGKSFLLFPTFLLSLPCKPLRIIGLVSEIILVCDVQPLNKSPQGSAGGLAVLDLRITRGDCGLIVPTAGFPKLVADVPFA